MKRLPCRICRTVVEMPPKFFTEASSVMTSQDFYMRQKRRLILPRAMEWHALAIVWMLRAVAHPLPKETRPDIGIAPHAKRSLVNFPFETEEDKVTVFKMCLLKLSLLESSRDTSKEQEEEFLREILAFTGPAWMGGERVHLVNFARSNDKAVKRLREEIGVPAPSGGAIVRVYPSKAAMPEPVRRLFGPHAAGITRWCRYIAVDGKNKSQAEIRDIISHELAHAYIFSCLGMRGHRLPRWFHESVALYLSDAKDEYVSQTDYGTQRIAFSTRDYNEYRLMFRYLEAAWGREGVYRFIRDAVLGELHSGSSPPVLTEAYGKKVLRLALRWQRTQEIMRSLTFASIVFLAGIAVLWAQRTSRARKQSQTDEELKHAEAAVEAVRMNIQQSGLTPQVVEEYALALVRVARILVRKGDRVAAKNNLQAARNAAPRSERVQCAIETVEDEMLGRVV